MTFDFTWMIGGPQGSGIETAANIFSRVSAKLGYQVFGKREYYSNIKGMHSYFAVRISDKNIQSNVNGANLLVAFDAETLLRHAEDVAKNGAIIYDPVILDTTLHEISFLVHGAKARLIEFLNSNGKELKVGSFLELAKADGVNDYPISFSGVLSEIANEQNNCVEAFQNMAEMSYKLAAYLSANVLDSDRNKLTKQMYDHYLQQAEEKDLKKIKLS